MRRSFRMIRGFRRVEGMVWMVGLGEELGRCNSMDWLWVNWWGKAGLMGLFVLMLWAIWIMWMQAIAVKCLTKCTGDLYSSFT